MRTSVLLLIVISLLGCSSKKTEKDKEKEKSELWSVKFAEAVLHESDSLIYYLIDEPKYEYDHAFLGDAIYKLKDIDSKYAEYLKSYIDYFLHEDGEIDGHKISNYNIDRVRPGLSMLTLYDDFGEEKYKRGIETLMEHMKG